MQVLLRNLSRQMLSYDSIWLILKSTSSELGEEWFKEALYYINEERSKFVKDFMG